MNTPPEVLRTVVSFLVLGGAFYVLLRWVAAPLLTQVGTGVEYALNVVAVGLLLPEYCWTRAQRRVTGRAAAFAYTYGDAVCALTGAGHRCAGTVLTALHEAAARLGHRGSLWIGTLAAAALVVPRLL
ncbi:hypothetical protein AR457_16180 [Streptomyces agglomeratus]|uniref:Uncharacterized protein n=1 Tax=Streptomyces agglomeratus TaxID=285458 RepID=A0A1E5P8C9_9ACTN|nr:hypothetical protein [Streptomyces agglomeratus]OEJ25778.1 hypothetical protein AS594_16030 [Streptomyces agglomeratus]OEJ40183.1 hypothetical protein BGK70_20475 [Streptomyces agglomeratus]OEJ45438.1 hypothetical protein AR457_16180 [Streptomyces agglomeratus]OEJ52730.1 hypothetical protein BGK72_20090 [Streptomyces agglomeratus]